MKTVCPRCDLNWTKVLTRMRSGYPAVQVIKAEIDRLAERLEETLAARDDAFLRNTGQD